VVSQIVAWLSVWQKIKKLGIKESNFKKFDITIVVDTFHKGKHLFVAGISGFLQQRIVFLILSQTLGAKSVGLYTVAGTLPNLLVHFPQQIATVVYSGTSKISGEEDKQKKINSIVLFIQLTLLLTMAIFLLSFPFSGQIVALIFGSDYEGLGTVFSSLIFSAGLMGVTTIIFNALAGLGMHIYSSYIGVFSMILLTVLCLFLTPIIGLEGAAYSQVLMSLISSTIGLGLLKKFYNFETKRFFYSPFKLWKLVS
jgi:O-antigen/teichoic acid export membrane protein